MKYFLRADIIPCKGFKRIALIDIINSELLFFDNQYGDILEELYLNGLDSLDESLKSLLQSNGYLIHAKEFSKFPRISNNSVDNSTFELENCIIDRNRNSTFDTYDVLQQLDELNCKYLQLRFYDYSDIVFEIIRYLNTTNSFIQNIEIIIQNSPDNFNKLEHLFRKNLRVNKLILFKSNETKIVDSTQGRSFLQIKGDIADCKSCGIISTSNFYINKYHYKEAKNFNTCLYKKISVDVNGEIRNCPSSQQSFGNIQEKSLTNALNQIEFKKYWNLTKDNIQVCKDCEFRYICTDCRAYTENTHTNDIGLDISKPLKCGYSPHTGEWEAWSKNPLKEKAIKFYGMEQLVENNEN